MEGVMRIGWKEENTAIHQGAAVHLLAGTKSAAITKAGLD